MALRHALLHRNDHPLRDLAPDAVNILSVYSGIREAEGGCNDL
jgi:hypothetical protein